MCQKGEGNSPDYVCKLPENCSSLEQDIKRQKFPPVCSFIGNKPVVCCSPGDNNNNNNNNHGADYNNTNNNNKTNRPAAPLSFTVKPAASSSYSAAESMFYLLIISLYNAIKLYYDFFGLAMAMSISHLSSHSISKFAFGQCFTERLKTIYHYKHWLAQEFFLGIVE